LIEIVAVEIFIKDSSLTVSSCYKPLINNTIDRNDWTAQFEGLLVIGRDFNANNTEWGSRKDCRDGLAIAQSAILHDTVILNDRSTTYHSAALNKDSSIDLILVNEEDLHHFC
jgi:hypothetical protein